MPPVPPPTPMPMYADATAKVLAASKAIVYKRRKVTNGKWNWCLVFGIGGRSLRSPQSCHHGNAV